MSAVAESNSTGPAAASTSALLAAEPRHRGDLAHPLGDLGLVEVVERREVHAARVALPKGARTSRIGVFSAPVCWSGNQIIPGSVTPNWAGDSWGPIPIVVAVGNYLSPNTPTGDPSILDGISITVAGVNIPLVAAGPN